MNINIIYYFHKIYIHKKIIMMNTKMQKDTTEHNIFHDEILLMKKELYNKISISLFLNFFRYIYNTYIHARACRP